ncbi:MAG: hypothetical protein ACRDA4_10370 [Filifactoraceae bacterium]
MQPISIKRFAEMTAKNNNDIDQHNLEETLREVLKDKKNGAKCMICGSPIWAAGSAITGSYMCFTCTTGETDDSEDYEVEE